jgi:hypothetical protein
VKRAVALLAVLAAAFAAPADALERLPAVLHVHSDLSTGDFSLEQLAGMAERQGIGALLVTENYLLRVEYGLPPFRALTRVVREERSVLEAGVDRYLANVARVRASNPRVLIVAGVEVLPHYFWSGSPLVLDMTAHNTQKNLLVLGLDAAALRALPVTGNPVTGRYGWASVLDVLPAVLLLPGVVLLARRRRSLRPMGRVVVVVTRRRWPAGALLCGVGVAALVRGWPFTLDPYPPYRDLGLAPHQDLMDYVDRVGGVTVWSFPEARDEGQRQIGPAGRVGARRRPPTIFENGELWPASARSRHDPRRATRRRLGPLLGQFASGTESAGGASENPASTASAPVRTWDRAHRVAGRGAIGEGGAGRAKGGRIRGAARETELVSPGSRRARLGLGGERGPSRRVADIRRGPIDGSRRAPARRPRDPRKNGAVVAV